MRLDKGLFAAIWRVNRWLPLLVLGWLLINLALHGWLHFALSPRVEAQQRQLLHLQAEARQMGGDNGDQILRQSREDLQTFRQAIPPKSGLTALVQEIFTLAAQAGLVIERVSYQPREVAEQGLLHYGLTFSVGGSYGQLKKFIFSLEQSPRLLAIEDISLSGADHQTVNLSIRLLTYFRPDLS
jgi:type IV pilus assembly protein PilO